MSALWHFVSIVHDDTMLTNTTSSKTSCTYARWGTSKVSTFSIAIARSNLFRIRIARDVVKWNYAEQPTRYDWNDTNQ